MKSYSTKKHEYILNFIESHTSFRFTAHDIYEQALADDQSIDLATVYRNLDRLVKMGRLIKFKATGEEANQYQYVTEDENCHRHLHLQCRKCGKIIHLDCRFMDEIADHLKGEHGFTVNCRDSVLLGLCKECSE